MPLGAIGGAFLIVVQSEVQDDDEEDDGGGITPDSYDYDGMLWSEDDDLEEDYEEPKARNVLVKVGRYAEDIVPRQTGDQFREHFRLSRPTFEKLEEKLHPYFEKDNLVGRPEIGLRKTMLIGIWLLANHECHRAVGDRFGVARSCTWSSLYKFCEAVTNLNKDEKIIAWPDQSRLLRIQSAFEGRNHTGFPGTVGAIDGCHIAIPAPPGEFKASYINRKGFYSVVLQGVCDSEKIFLDVDIGEVGSVHDAEIYKRSDLYKMLSKGESGLNPNQHLIGDKAYPVSTFLLAPYKQTNQLNVVKKRFNKRLSKSRMVIEGAFGLLKGRFRKLRYVEMRRPDFVAMVIFTCCVLHNVCIMNNDWEWVENADPDNDDDDVDQATVNALSNVPLQKTRGDIKRTQIARSFRNLAPAP